MQAFSIAQSVPNLPIYKIISKVIVKQYIICYNKSTKSNEGQIWYKWVK